MAARKSDSRSRRVPSRLAGCDDAPELVAVYEQAEAEIRLGFASVARAVERIDSTFSNGTRGISLKSRHRNYCDVDFTSPESTITELRRDIWGVLIERSEIRKAMSIAAWKELSEKIERETPPPITAANVSGMLDQFRADIPDMLRTAVAEVFEFLRPHSGWGETWKTNTEFEIGERVVLSGFVTPGWWRGAKTDWTIAGDWYEQRLIALENVFAMVAGHVRQDGGGHFAKLSDAIKACRGGPCHGATDLFEFRGYRRGTLHLKMLRMDLVARLNAIAGGARLKPVGS